MRLLSSLPRPRAAVCGGCLLLGLLLPTAASAQWIYATGTTLDVAGVLVTPRDVVTDLPGTILTTAIAGLPASARIIGVHGDGSDLLFVSSEAVALPGGVFADRRNVVSLAGGSYALAFTGPSLSAATALDGVSLDASGHILFSVDSPSDLGGGLLADDADVIAFNGFFYSTFFDASAASVPEALDVDGLHYDVPGDALLLSFDSAGRIDGIDFGREDILRFEFGGGGWSLEHDASTTEPDLVTSNLVAVPEPTLALGLLGGVSTLAVTRRNPFRR